MNKILGLSMRTSSGTAEAGITSSNILMEERVTGLMVAIIREKLLKTALSTKRRLSKFAIFSYLDVRLSLLIQTVMMSNGQ